MTHFNRKKFEAKTAASGLEIVLAARMRYQTKRFKAAAK
jgi:hypothetical protein